MNKKQDNKKTKYKQLPNNRFKRIPVNSENKISNLNENGKPQGGKILQKNDNKKYIDNITTVSKNNKLSIRDGKNSLNEGKEFSQYKNMEKLKIHSAESLTILSKLKNSYRSKKGKIYIRDFFIYNKNETNYNIIKSDNNNIINSKNKNMGKNPIEPDDKAKNFEVLKDNNINNDIKQKKLKIFISDKYYNKKEGFYNFGNTCYMNSFLQIFIHVPGLIELLMDYKNKIDENSFLNYLLEIADNPSKDNLWNLRRAFMQKNSSYKYYQQEDSQEFGAELLKGINNELSDLEYFILGWKIEEGFNLKNINSKGIKKIKLDKLNELLKNEGSDFQYQTVVNYFFYYYETVLIICDNKIVNFKYYGDVDNQLAFDKEDLCVYSINLINLLKKKYLLGNNKLIKLPIVFNITLLRALIDKPLIKTKVSIDLEIDLRDFLDKDFGDYSLETKYTLYALNVCHSSCKRYGHYYSYILINDEWYQFNDWRVSKADKNMIKEDSPYIYGIYYISKDYLNSLNSIKNKNS